MRYIFDNFYHIGLRCFPVPVTDNPKYWPIRLISSLNCAFVNNNSKCTPLPGCTVYHWERHISKVYNSVLSSILVGSAYQCCGSGFFLTFVCGNTLVYKNMHLQTTTIQFSSVQFSTVIIFRETRYAIQIKYITYNHNSRILRRAFDPSFDVFLMVQQQLHSPCYMYLRDIPDSIPSVVVLISVADPDVL